MDEREPKAIATANYLQYINGGEEAILIPFPPVLMAGLIVTATEILPTPRMAAIVVWAFVQNMLMQSSEDEVRH